jgi:hypothetical protein
MADTPMSRLSAAITAAVLAFEDETGVLVMQAKVDRQWDEVRPLLVSITPGLDKEVVRETQARKCEVKDDLLRRLFGLDQASEELKVS